MSLIGECVCVCVCVRVYIYTHTPRAQGYAQPYTNPQKHRFSNGQTYIGPIRPSMIYKRRCMILHHGKKMRTPLRLGIIVKETKFNHEDRMHDCADDKMHEYTLVIA